MFYFFFILTIQIYQEKLTQKMKHFYVLMALGKYYKSYKLIFQNKKCILFIILAVLIIAIQAENETPATETAANEDCMYFFQ